jgi:hypothetical protein
MCGLGLAHCLVEDVLNEHIDQLSAAMSDFDSFRPPAVQHPEPMLLDFQELPIKSQSIRAVRLRLKRELLLRVPQHFFQRNQHDGSL